MIKLLIFFFLMTLAELLAEFTSTVHVSVTPPPQPAKPQTQALPPLRLWHLNRVDCVFADLVPKVSQRLKLLSKCESDFLLGTRKKPSLGKKVPYLGWKVTPLLDVWNLKDESMPRGTGKFTESLYRNLEELKPNALSFNPRNVAISPLALELALACLLMGARYNTGKEINRYLDVTPESLPLKYHSIISQLQLKNQPSVRMLYQIHLEGAFFPVKEDFSRQLNEIFDTRIEEANFRSGSPAELEKLNQIVAKSTEGHIGEAFTSEIVNEHAQLLLVTNLYFKARWENQFQKSYGFNGDFNLPEGKTIKATYMSRESIFYHYKENKDGKYKMLELPFLSGNDNPGLFSMIVILPDEVDGIESVEEHITSDDSWLKNFDLVSSKDVKIVKPTIPRFTINSKTNLKNALNEMDVVLLFEDNSDFGNLNDRRNIKTSKLHQWIYLDVNEKGANVSPRLENLPVSEFEPAKRTVNFHANHPFMFAIVQRITKSVLLMGRVMKPNFDELFAKNKEDSKK